jgi:hypothetical protein
MGIEDSKKSIIGVRRSDILLHGDRLPVGWEIVTNICRELRISETRSDWIELPTARLRCRRGNIAVLGQIAYFEIFRMYDLK